MREINPLKTEEELRSQVEKLELEEIKELAYLMLRSRDRIRYRTAKSERKKKLKQQEENK